MIKALIVGCVCFIAVACGRQPATSVEKGLPGTKAGTDQDLWFHQRVDHFDPANTAEFKQRYFEDSSLAHGDAAPIFLYLCGEAPCAAWDTTIILGSNAATFHGHMLGLEHRYYGLSFPVADFSTDNLRFLSTRQALADVASFVTQIKASRGWHGPVIAIGGSYAGSLAAYVRALYPDVVAGALASSAPIRAKEDFSEYDLHTALSLTSDCARAAREFVAAMDHAIDAGGEQFEAVLTAFGLPATTTAYDFASELTDVPSAIAQDGLSSNDFCSALALKTAPERLAKLGAYYQQVHAPESAARDPTDTKLPDGNESGGRAWYYQLCTDYGYWQIADADRSRSLWSKAVDLGHERRTCQTLFGISHPIDTARTNHEFYDHVVSHQTTRVFFSNGQLDPWSELSLTTAPADSKERDIAAAVIGGSHHCADIFPESPGDSEALKEVRHAFTARLSQWLSRRPESVPAPSTYAEMSRADFKSLPRRLRTLP